ncbi:MAG: HD-like signal output (HDOD) protein [Halioglobus sp.]|jgi:HD-like signal output (HDOD) protein
MFKKWLSAIFFFKKSKATEPCDNGDPSSDPQEKIVEADSEPSIVVYEEDNTSQPLLHDPTTVSRAFYDLIFSFRSDRDESMNELEKSICAQLTQMIKDQSIPEEYIPRLPVIVTKVLDLLAKDGATDDLSKTIEQDPGLTHDLFALANSVAFKRSRDNKMSSVRQVVIHLGQKEVNKMAVRLMLQPMMQVHHVYFKLFGDIIWEHSHETAAFCAAIFESQGEEPFDGFLLGLLHDIGKIVAFSVIVDAIKDSDPSLMPGSRRFKAIIEHTSRQATFFVGKQWGLPANLMIAFRDHSVTNKSPEMSDAGRALHWANLLSELCLLVKADMCDPGGIVDRMEQEGMPRELCQKLFDGSINPPEAAESASS